MARGTHERGLLPTPGVLAGRRARRGGAIREKVAVLPMPCFLLLLVAFALCVPVPARAEPTARFKDVAPAAAEAAPPHRTAEHPAPRRGTAEHAQPRRPAARVVPSHAPPPARQRAATAPNADVAPPSHSWAKASIAELMRRARDDEQQGDAARAMTDYTRAIQLDSTYGPAYIRLGRLREAAGEYREAERLYTSAARLHEYTAEALVHRAELFLHTGRQARAFRDLRAAVQLDDTNTALRRRLASWYAKRRMWPAALAQWRRLLAELESHPGSSGLREARLQVEALGVLAGPCDPVRAGASDASWVRRALAGMAR